MPPATNQFHKPAGWPELLMFDLDGTLADTKADLATAVNHALIDVGVAPLSTEVIAGYVGDGVRQLLAHALGENGTPRYEEAQRRFRHHYTRHLLDTTQLYPGMEALLHRLSGRRKVVVTNKPIEFTTPIIDGLRVTGHFDLVIGSDGATPLKPDPSMLVRALERLGVASDRAVMIGDGVNDILAARAAAVRSCAVGYGLTSAEVLQVAGPDYFCHRVEDLALMLSGSAG